MADLDNLRPRLERAFEFAGRQVRATIERTPDYFPIYTVGGAGSTRGSSGPTGAAGSTPG